MPGVPIDTLQSATHDVDIVRSGANGAMVRLRDKQSLPNKDFILKYDVAGRADRGRGADARRFAGRLLHPDPAAAGARRCRRDHAEGAGLRARHFGLDERLPDREGEGGDELCARRPEPARHVQPDHLLRATPRFSSRSRCRQRARTSLPRRRSWLDGTAAAAPR